MLRVRPGAGKELIAKANLPLPAGDRQPAAAVAQGVGNQVPVHPAQRLRAGPNRHILPVKPQFRRGSRRLQLRIKFRQSLPQRRQGRHLSALQRQGAALKPGIEEQLFQKRFQFPQPLPHDAQVLPLPFRFPLQQFQIAHGPGQGRADVMRDTGHGVFQVLFPAQGLLAKPPPLLQPLVHRLAQPPGGRAGHPHGQAQIAFRRSLLQHPGHFQHLDAVGPQAQSGGS